MGVKPTELVRLASVRPAAPTLKTETSLEPAFTAKSQRPSLLRATAPWEPSDAPVPRPPVATVAAAVSRPSAPRVRTAKRVFMMQDLRKKIERRESLSGDNA